MTEKPEISTLCHAYIFSLVDYFLQLLRLVKNQQIFLIQVSANRVKNSFAILDLLKTHDSYQQIIHFE